MISITRKNNRVIVEQDGLTPDGFFLQGTPTFRVSLATAEWERLAEELNDDGIVHAIYDAITGHNDYRVKLHVINKLGVIR